MRINLGNTPLFRGMTVPDIEEMLRCLRAAERTYKKGAVILPEGTPTEQLGVVLSGRVIIEMGDVWGNNSVLSSVGAGGIFAEAYACVPGEPLMVNVTAAEDTEVLLLHIGQVLEPCAKVCPRHLRLLRRSAVQGAHLLLCRQGADAVRQTQKNRRPAETRNAAGRRLRCPARADSGDVKTSLLGAVAPYVPNSSFIIRGIVSMQRSVLTNTPEEAVVSSAPYW